METLEEIHATTHDEYGLKGWGLLAVPREVHHPLWLEARSHSLLCSRAGVLCTAKKNISMQDALSAVDAAKAYYDRLQSEEEFDCLYATTVELADQHAVGQPELPRYRCHPSRYEDGSGTHKYTTAIAILTLKHVICYLVN